MRLIDADVLKQKLGSGWVNAEFAFYMINETPTADAEIVKHGRWITDDEEHQAGWICTNCYINACRAHIFCPNCGAKMEGGEEDDCAS